MEIQDIHLCCCVVLCSDHSRDDISLSGNINVGYAILLTAGVTSLEL